MDVTSCTEADSKLATCYNVVNFSDGDTSTKGADVDKGGIVYLVMDNVSGLTDTSTIDLVNFSLYHGGETGIDNAWIIKLQSEDGLTLYCEDNTIGHISGGSQWDSWDMTSCTTWTKAKLDDLRVYMGSGDDGGGEMAFIYELDINVTFTKPPPHFSNPQINETTVFPNLYINHSINISNSPTQYLFSWNGSGASCDTWVNSSWQSASGDSFIASNVSQIASACADKTIGWRFCGNSSEGINCSDIESYNVNSYGNLEVNITYPTGNLSLNYSENWYINVTVNCTGGALAKCGTVYANARYNGSGANPDTLMNTTTGATPFYIQTTSGAGDVGENLTDGVSPSTTSGTYGIAFDSSDDSYWICGSILSYTIHHYNASGSDLTDDIDMGSEDCQAITYDSSDDTFWFTDTNDDEVRHINKSSDYLSDNFDTASAGCTSPYGVTLDTRDDSFWVYCNDDFFVYHFNSSGDNQTDGFSVSSGIDNLAYEIVFDDRDNTFWILNLDDDFINHFNSSGANLTDGFSIGSAGAETSYGLTFESADYSFWVFDDPDNFIYHFGGGEGSGANPESTTLNYGENWTVGFSLNTTSTTYNLHHLIDVLFNSSYGNASVVENSTDNHFVKINEIPIFSSYWDDNGTVDGEGVGYFNVTVIPTNGTVYLEINGTNVTATNVTANVYNASYNFTDDGVYTYRWHSWGPSSSAFYNSSEDRSYTVNLNYGSLNVSLNYPTSTLDVNYSDTWNINATVKCIGSGVNYKCGDVYANARYNSSSATPDTLINSTEGGTPFYIRIVTKNLSNFSNLANNRFGVAYDSVNNTLWVVKSVGPNCVYQEYNKSGNLFQSHLISGLICKGIEYDSTDDTIWIVRDTSHDMLHYDKSGTDEGDGFNLATGNDDPGGLAFDSDNNTLWVVDTVDDFVYHYDKSGTNLSDGFSIGSSYTGIIYDPQEDAFWLVNSTDADLVSKTGASLSRTFSGSPGADLKGGDFDTSDDSFWIQSETVDVVYNYGGEEKIYNPYFKNIKEGESYNISWELNTTAIGSDIYYLIDVLFNSSYGNASVEENHTSDTTIEINVTGVVGDSYTGNASLNFSMSSTTDKTIDLTKSPSLTLSYFIDLFKNIFLLRSFFQSLTFDFFSGSFVSLSRSLYQNVTIDPTLTGYGYGAFRTVSQTINIDTFVSRILFSFKNIYQLLTFDIFAGRSFLLFRKIAQILSIIPFVVRFVSSSAKINQPLTFSDDVDILIGRTHYQPISISSLAGRFIDITYQPFQLINIDTSIARVSSFPRQFYQLIQIDAFVSRTITLSKSIYQLISIDTFTSRIPSYFKNLFQLIQLSIYLSTGETQKITEQISQLINIDSYQTRLFSGFININQQIIFNIFTSRISEIFINLNQQISLDTFVQRIGMFQRSITQSFSISASVDRFIIMSKSVTQIININTYISRSFQPFITLFQTLNLDVFAERLISISYSLSQLLNFDDSVTRTPFYFTDIPNHNNHSLLKLSPNLLKNSFTTYTD
jgi:hypothetical protein